MKFLQIMPPEESFLEANLELITVISITLIMVIIVYDKSRGLVNRILRKK